MLTEIHGKVGWMDDRSLTFLSIKFQSPFGWMNGVSS